jgi:hypothetical protein
VSASADSLTRVGEASAFGFLPRFSEHERDQQDDDDDDEEGAYSDVHAVMPTHLGETSL